jgi:hypothetical protein
MNSNAQSARLLTGSIETSTRMAMYQLQSAANAM